jgi:hypothetical protein
MANTIAGNWRNSYPKLHDFVGKLHEVFTSVLVQEQVLRDLKDATNQYLVAKQQQEDLNEERNNWLERIAQDPRLREESQPIKGHVWAMERYQALEGSQLVPGSQIVPGWWPRELSEREIPKKDQFHLPPPLGNEKESDIGRKFTRAELTYALLLVHDAHGEYPELLPSELRDLDSCWLKLYSLKQDVNDSWVYVLEAWLRKLEVNGGESTAGGTTNTTSQSVECPNVKPYSNPPTYARDKWIYDNIEGCKSFRMLQLAMEKIARREQFELLTSGQGFKNAADRYADFHGLPKRRFSI